MRVVGGSLRSRPIAGPKSDGVRPTATACARRCSISSRTPMAIRSPARACSTCSPAPARSASRRSRAARLTRCSSTRAWRRARCCATMSRRSASAASPAFSAATPPSSGPAHPLEPFTLAFLDPPYGKGLAEKALASARDGGWLKPRALVVVEEAADAGFAAPEGFEELERRQYDDTEFVFLRRLLSPAAG